MAIIKKILSMIILSLFFSCATGQENKKMIQNFFYDIHKIEDIDILAKKYFAFPDSIRTLSHEQKEYLSIIITSLKERVDPEGITTLFVGPLDNPSAFMIENKSSLQDMYTVKYKGEIICDIWTKNLKILSFSTMNKGDKKYFIPIF